MSQFNRNKLHIIGFPVESGSIKHKYDTHTLSLEISKEKKGVLRMEKM